MTGDPDISLALAGIFLMGLGLNLTPCVYPMLSVTVSLFATGRQQSHFQAFIKAVVYVLGIATMYSTLGALAAVTGGLFGGVLQNRFVLTAISIFFVILSLSMFGVYTFQMPAFIRDKAQKMGKVGGFLGLYLSGVVVGVFAAPCVGPPIIALLTYVGSIGNPWHGFLIFFVLSLGLGTPYLLLGTFSGLIRYIPKSGVWMVWVEKFFGVVLLLFAAFYLILAWKPHLLTLVGPAPKEAVQWESYSGQKVASAASEKKPALLDFYADWCIPCHELDRFTYTDPNVIQALEGFRRFKVDLTRADATETTQIAEKFNIQGIPTIVFLNEDGAEVKDARIVGFVPPKEFLASVFKVVESRGSNPNNQPWEKLIGTAAEEWEVADWLNSKSLALQELQGKVILVRFWTGPHCPFCRASAAALNEFYEKYHRQGLDVVGLYHHKSTEPLSQEVVRKLAQEFGFKFPVAIDYDWRTLKQWWLDKVETDWTSVSFLIDREGIIRHIHPGGQYVKGDRDYEAMESGIKELLSK